LLFLTFSFKVCRQKAAWFCFWARGGSSNARVVSSFSGQFLEKGTFTGF